jgi:hypothetical protein
MKYGRHLNILLALSVCSALLFTACGGGSGSRGDIDSDDDGVLNTVDVDDDNNGLIEISSLEQLDAMRNDLKGSSLNGDDTGCPKTGCNGYELVADLDFDTNHNNSVADETYNNWVPVGNSPDAFTANFNGNGYVIRNLTINRPGDTNVGLFGAVFGNSTSPIEIKDVVLEGPLMSVIGSQHVGGLVGYAYHNGSNVTISHCSVAGSIIASAIDVGGLVGYASGATISNSNASSSVASSGYHIGGLVGYAGNGTDISGSYATGAVSGGGSGVGGLVGAANYRLSPTSKNTITTTISESFATGTVTNAGDYVGGLVGISYYTTISNTYATGGVTATGSNIGGLVGDANVNTDIEYSYAVNGVTGTTNVGGFVGFQDTASFTENYFATDTSPPRASSIGATGHTTDELKCPTAPNDCVSGVYNGWDTNIWSFGTVNQLPDLVFHRP